MTTREGVFCSVYPGKSLTGLLCLVCWFSLALAYPLCTNMDAPSQVSGTLSFCSAPEYTQKGCCTPKDDSAIANSFNKMNISDTGCAAVVKQILCAQCDAFSATLFGQVAQDQRSIPYLCTSSNSTSTGQGYCYDVWNACVNTTIQHSIFSPGLYPGPLSPSSSLAAKVAVGDILGNIFSSEGEFCTGFGPSNVTTDYCFSGGPFVPPPAPSNYSLPEDMCFEKVGEDIYLNLVPYPDGSNRVALTNQAGLVWLATAPGPGNSLIYNISKPFLDIRDRVTNQDELGLLGFAFHPDFANNGRIFVSYNCDKQKWADCGGTCACNEETNCDPTNLQGGQLGADTGSNPCRYSSIIAEYSANSSTNASASPLETEVVNPVEVRRIFTMSLAYMSHHAGGLLFGPLDKYLYFMMGDGGNVGDPFNFAQNKKSLLGKILRLDVDSSPSATEISNQDLWGEYSIPPSNPFIGENGSRPEIWALGLRNPWRCTFDSKSPLYFYCGDVGEERVEEVDLISRGGNYGWRVYEGNLSYIPSLSPGGNTSATSITPISPVLEYDHPVVLGNIQGFAAITGGYTSYSEQDPCLYGKYVYADLFGTMYVGDEVPKFSGNYRSQQINYHCSVNSPMNCSDNGTLPLQNIYAFGIDNVDNVYILSGSGVFRIVHPGNCNKICNVVLPASAPSPAPVPSGNPSVPALSPLAPSPESSAHSKYPPVFHLFVSAFTCKLLATMFAW